MNQRRSIHARYGLLVASLMLFAIAVLICLPSNPTIDGESLQVDKTHPLWVTPPQETIDRIQVGMTHQQVDKIIGDFALSAMAHANWVRINYGDLRIVFERREGQLLVISVSNETLGNYFGPISN